MLSVFIILGSFFFFLAFGVLHKQNSEINVVEE